jgi:hypothetical protein
MILNKIISVIQKITYRFRKNIKDSIFNIIDREYFIDDGDFFEIVIELNNDRLLIMSFSSDGYFISLEMEEYNRRNRIIIMQRNFNGDYYIFTKNIYNLNNDYVDFYLDYYNENIEINYKLAEEIINDLINIFNKYILNSTEEKYKIYLMQCYNKIVNYKNEKYLIKEIYPNGIPIMPPNVRPDIDSEYMIVQVCQGCRIIEKRKKPCAFCVSYLNSKYIEKEEYELKIHLNYILNSFPNQIKKVRYIFLSDGDALASKNITSYLKITKEYIPQVKRFESFVSTRTIIELGQNNSTSASSALISRGPIQLLALPWGSRSMSKTLPVSRASSTARETARLVLPTPPF